MGLRYTHKWKLPRVELAGLASYATQSDRAGNPIDYRDDYYAGDLTATLNGWSVGGGVDVLQGDGVKGFTAPIGTLHKFQGWADKFLTTPANGIEDLYATGGVTLKGVGSLDTLSMVAAYHDYEAEQISADYGEEWNLSIAAKIKRVNLMLKYADYRQGIPAVGRSTEKVWMQFEFIW